VIALAVEWDTLWMMDCHAYAAAFAGWWVDELGDKLCIEGETVRSADGTELEIDFDSLDTRLWPLCIVI